ncbi:MAG: V4R domain-containing protein [Pigmentiphaga sp.]
MAELKDRLEHRNGGIFDDDRRYIIMRADVLMGILHQLPAEQRPAVLAAMADSVAANGGKSAQAYFEAIGRDPAVLLDVMMSSSADLGWGSWRFVAPDGSAPSPANLPNGLHVEVRNSPFAAGHGPAESPVCAPIAGMLRAVCDLLVGGATVTETECAAQGCAHCRFQIEPTPRA